MSGVKIANENTTNGCSGEESKFNFLVNSKETSGSSEGTLIIWKASDNPEDF